MFVPVCAILRVTTAVPTSSSSQLIFYLHPRPVKGPVRLGPGWHEISPGSCAVRCTLKYDNCRSVMYNKSTGLCTPGSWMNDDHPPPSAIEGDLYHSFHCNESQGFRVIHSRSKLACVGKFGPPMTYLQAKEACRRRGGFLASVKTWDKLMMLRDTFGVYEEVWVGGDELKEEGRFVWVEDGKLLPIGSSLFADYQPDNRLGDEDCLCLQQIGQELGDWMCSSLFKYFCEVSIP